MENQIWIFYGLLSALTAAFVTIFGKIGMQNLDTMLATTIRALFMALVFVIFFIGSGKIQLVKHVDSRSLFYILISSLFGALSWYAYFYALRYGPASKVGALDRTSILFIVLLAAIFLGESLSLKTLLGAVLMSAGAILIVW